MKEEEIMRVNNNNNNKNNNKKKKKKKEVYKKINEIGKCEISHVTARKKMEGDEKEVV